jgi:hypothetical protein
LGEVCLATATSAKDASRKFGQVACSNALLLRG